MLCIGLVGCTTDPSESINPETALHRSINKYTDVILHDIFSPPSASRNYVYPFIAGYETVCLFDENYQSLAGQFHQLKPLQSLNIDIYAAAATALTSLFGDNFDFEDSV